ncbi:cytochrome P450 [Purpureocillium lavendulum]|uniref:Cytochrome P450 n=1 Tax=Purpureocillium lavendulum TaxID=1247861 RepID=A0AB34FQ91_9HYPO|nr:cytochrome P450 [Purpureocillium lavendulum]
MESTQPVGGAAPTEHAAIAGGILSHALGSSPRTATLLAAIVLGAGLAVSFLGWLLTPSLDPREPPLLKPTIPLVGHIINLIRFQGEFHPSLRRTNPDVPLATVPMLNGKLYTIFDPDLIQATLRLKAASFEPFVVGFAQKSFNLSDATFAKILSHPQLVPEFTDAIHRSFHPTALAQMNLHFLSTISARLDAVADAGKVDATNPGRESRAADGALEIGNLFLWCRDVMSVASTKALYGDSDPFSKDPSLVDAIWTFEKVLPLFLLSLFPSITMPKGYQARETMQQTMKAYYDAETDINDPTTSTLTFNRASTLRQYGFNGEEIAKLECILPIAATTNAVPTFFWMLIFVLSRPSLAARLRAEVEAAASFDQAAGTVTFDITGFDQQLPLMVSCYRETMRVVNRSVSMRRAMSDINLTAADGRTYLLKKGVDIQMSAGVTHGERRIWGDDAGDFNPERFLAPQGDAAPAAKGVRSSEGERKKKTAYFPFGGGRHLCPGRNLAFCEILGFMAMILLRFEVEPVGMAFDDLQMDGSKLSAPSCKPVDGGEGLGARIRVRKGWEATTFAFKC